MRKMINGEDSTLENWLKTTTFILGKDSDAVLFLEELIDSQGEKEEVTTNERAFIKLLFHLHFKTSGYL